MVLLLILLFITFSGFIVTFVFFMLLSEHLIMGQIFLLTGLVAFLVLFLTLLVISVKKYIKQKNQVLQKRLDLWSNISYHVNLIGEDIAQELPVAVIVFDEEYEIKWVNQHAKMIFGPNLIGHKLFDITKDFEQIKKTEKFIVKSSQAYYEAQAKTEGKTVYLFNVTKQLELQTKYNSQIPVIGFIELENLDRVLFEFDFSERSSIKNQYLSAISEWASRFKSLIKSVSEGRLMLVTTRDYLKEMIKDKFSILALIREISNQNQLKISASIGIASWDKGYEELENIATSAIDLAEKRGGDQVVINIENEKIEYIGGKTEAFQKQSKVDVRINAARIRDLIEQADNVIVMGHINADADAFGAMLLINKMTVALGMKSHFVLDFDRVDQTVRDIVDYLRVKDPAALTSMVSTSEALKRITTNTLLIIVDTQGESLVHSPELMKINKRLLIDHHRPGIDAIQTEFSYVETSASSSVQLCVELLSFWKEEVEFSEEEASIFYAGLIIDTNDFTNRTSSRTFEVASKLVEMGSDVIIVKSWLRRDLTRTLKINDYLSRAEIIGQKYALLKIKDQVEDRILLAQISDELMTINGMDAAFCVAQVNNEVAISARSYGLLNVQIIMEEFGGGGHLTASAAQISNSDIDEIYEKLKFILESEYQAGGVETMQIILLNDVKNKGKKDQIIEVASGYGQYLINSKQAIQATKENINELQKRIALANANEQKQIEIMKKIKSEIDGKMLNIGVQIGKNEKLFGTVTTKQIAEDFETVFGIKLDKKKLSLESDVNSLGIYEVNVDLYKDIKAIFEINVVNKE